ncbi:MAG: hypothetical protein Q8M08_02650 [Bacteroidales bacterium]|nr:hypothetical protein [Bacteroidales bacterium]
MLCLSSVVRTILFILKTGFCRLVISNCRQPVLIMVLILLNCTPCKAQKADQTCIKVDKFVREYIHFSHLGPGYSRDISQDIIDQFGILFEKDAVLYWDLFRSSSDMSHSTLPVTEYVDRARKFYAPKQPLLDYPSVKTSVSWDGKHAVVRLVKINKIVDVEDQILNINRVKLKLNINLAGDEPLIQSIVEDDRLSFINRFSIGYNVAWSNVLSSVTGNPVIRIAPDVQFGGFKTTSRMFFQYGVMLEIRLNRVRREELLFSTGIFYTKLPITALMSGYSRSFPDTLDKTTPNPITCTTFERSNEVTEKIIVSRIEIPLLFKACLNDWFYLKAGTALGYVKATSLINYELSRTGGGLITDLSTQNQYFLDKDHELDQGYHGYYRNKRYHFPNDRFLDKIILSIQLATGFEKQLNYFSFGLEPNISFGMNSLSKRSVSGNYYLTSIKGFHSILESVKMPAFEFTFGIRLLISYLFKD